MRTHSLILRVRDRTQVGRRRRHFAPINGLPQDRGKFNIFRFSNVISLPLGLHYKSNSHPWGSQILLLVDKNFVELLKINTEVSEGEIKILKALLVFGQVSGFICMPYLEWLVSSAYILGSEYVRQCGKSLIYISKTEEVPKLFPGEHHILDISELTYKNLDDKSVFDYLNKKQTIDGWSNKSHSISIFVTKYRDLLYQMPF